MKRTLATLGVVGLAALVVSAPAAADRGHDDSDDTIAICHAGSNSKSGNYTLNIVAVPSLDGHDNHDKDIIPPHDGMDYGQNWDEAGRAIYTNGCVVPPVVVPPVVEPPVVNPPIVNPPVVEPPVVNPPVVEVPPVVVVPPVEPVVVPPVVVEPPVETVQQPAVVAPAAGAVAAPAQPAAVQPAARTGAPVTTSLGTNQGYNAQTAVGGAEGSPAWLGGLGALAAAGAAVAVRRRSGATS